MSHVRISQKVKGILVSHLWHIIFIWRQRYWKICISVLLPIFAKIFILNVWQVSEYACYNSYVSKIYLTVLCQCKKVTVESDRFSLNTGRKLNVHNTFRSCPKRLLKVLGIIHLLRTQNIWRNIAYPLICTGRMQRHHPKLD